MPSRFLAAAAACQLGFALPLVAQDITASSNAASMHDSTSWSAGRREGHTTADEAVVAHSGLLGFVAGIPLGLGIVPLIGLHPYALVGGGVAVAGVIGAGKLGTSVPPVASLERATRQGPEFERGMREGYAERVRARRMKAATDGASAGMAVGLGYVVLLLTQLD